MTGQGGGAQDMGVWWRGYTPLGGGHNGSGLPGGVRRFMSLSQLGHLPGPRRIWPPYLPGFLRSLYDRGMVWWHAWLDACTVS